MIACANIAGLVLVRGVSRRGEIAVRLALGATRTRIVRLLIVENLVLALPGALLGVLLAQHGIPVLVGYAEWLAAPRAPLLQHRGRPSRHRFRGAGRLRERARLRIRPRAAELARRSGVGHQRGRVAARRGARTTARGSRGRAGGGLAAAAGRRRPGDPQPRGGAAREPRLRRQPGDGRSRWTSSRTGTTSLAGRVFYRELLDAARADPGIESATLAALRSDGVPRDARAARGDRRLRAASRRRSGVHVEHRRLRTTSARFGSASWPGERSRIVTTRASAPVAIVNDTLARRFWGGAANGIGKRIRVAEGEWRTVIGVAADVKYSRIDESPRPYFYLPLLQSYRSSMILHTRGPAPVDRLVEQARGHVAALDADLPILYAQAAGGRDARGADHVRPDRDDAVHLRGGRHGAGRDGHLRAGVVHRRTEHARDRHPHGTRRGTAFPSFADFSDEACGSVRWARLSASSGPSALSRLLGSALFGVSATDGISFARALAVVLGGVVVATIVPAWRAARTNPLSALRHQ